MSAQAVNEFPRQFHLLVDVFADSQPVPGPQAPGGAPFLHLVVPPGVSALLPPANGNEHCSLASWDAGSCPSPNTILLEPILNEDRQPRLLVMTPPGLRLRVNDQHALPLSALSERDQFRFSEDRAFVVTLFHQPQIGAPPPKLIGSKCPVCRGLFTETSRCLVCQCGCGLHLEGEKSDPNALQCAKAVSRCPACKQMVTLQAGYSYLPEVPHED